MPDTFNNEYDLTRSRQSEPNWQEAPVSEKPIGDTKTETPYDRLKRILAEKVHNPSITLQVPMREGLSIRYSPNIEAEDFELWRRNSVAGNRRARRSEDGEVDQHRFMASVVYNTAEIFLVDGEDVYLNNNVDTPLNFKEQASLRQIFGITASTATELVRKVFANDAHVLSAGAQILEAAGFGDELAEDASPN